MLRLKVCVKCIRRVLCRYQNDAKLLGMADDQKNSVGPVGRALAENIARIRKAQRLTYIALAERLAQNGRPIAVLGLRRIEKNERRVDVDDLLALSVALDVSPLVLLLPKEPGEYLVTPNIRTSMAQVYLWMVGQRRSPHGRSELMAAEEEQLARLLFRKALPWAAPPDGDTAEWLRDPEKAAAKAIKRLYANLFEGSPEHWLATIPMEPNPDSDGQPNAPADADE